MPFSISSLPSSTDLASRFWWHQVWLPTAWPARGHLLEDAGLVGGMLADREEDRPRAVRRERGEDRHRALRPRAVVEGEHDFAGAQEVMLLEVLEAETGTAGGVDLDRARDAERIRIAGAGGWCRGGFRRCRAAFAGGDACAMTGAVSAGVARCATVGDTSPGARRDGRGRFIDDGDRA